MYRAIIFILILIFFSPIHANSFNLGLNPPTWQPNYFKYKLTSTFELENLVFLKTNVPAPFEGVLLLKDDLSDIKTEINRIIKLEKDCIVNQRLICDQRIKKKNKDCLALNEKLIKDKKELNNILKFKNKEYKKLKFKNDVTLILSGTFLTVLTASLVYATL